MFKIIQENEVETETVLWLVEGPKFRNIAVLN